MKSEFINPFLNATLNVIKTMAMLDPVAGKPFLKKDKVATGDISGVIGLTGHKKGAIVISFSTSAICQIVSGMLGEKYTEINDDITDAVGELTNMISGDARRSLQEQGIIFEAGIPNIVSGVGHQIESMTKGPVVAIPFELNGAKFVVEASFDN